jgi:hypothetical protein
MDDEDPYTCIGICQKDPQSGLCEGCGRRLSPPEAPESSAQAGDDAGAEAAGANR